MLIPVEATANFKVGLVPTIVTIENLVGINLPIIDPTITVMNRTVVTSNTLVSVVRKRAFIGQVDPDFNGIVAFSVASFTLGSSQERVVDLGKLLLGVPPGTSGVLQTHEFTISNGGPAPQNLVTVFITGLIESSVSADPLRVVNL